MKNRSSCFLISLLLIFLTLTVSFTAFSEENCLETFLNGDFSVPFSFVLSSPEYRTLPQFGKERLDSLNRLIKHFSMEMCIDGNISSTAFFIDGEKLYSVAEKVSGGISRNAYSFDPERIYEHPVREQDNPLTGFLDNHFFLVNHLLDSIYPMLERMKDTFPDMTKMTDEKMNFKEYGKSVRKLIITFPSEYVKEHFPGALTDLTDSDETSIFIRRLIFSGTQRIALYLDGDSHIIRVNYDGVLGLSSESLRKVALSWRCLHQENRKKDELSLKTPEVKGFNRYNLNYIRHLDLTDPDHQTVGWDFQLDLKSGDDKKKVRYYADLSLTKEILKGEAFFSERRDRQEDRISVRTELGKGKKGEYAGTLEITNNSGKIVTSDVVSGISISPCGSLSDFHADPATSTDIPDISERLTDAELNSAISEILIRKLLTLPAEDLDFLSRDIPEDVWKSIIQIIF